MIIKYAGWIIQYAGGAKRKGILERVRNAQFQIIMCLETVSLGLFAIIHNAVVL